MQTMKELYKIGRGPSSSHTLAPERACRLFTDTFGPFPYYRAELFGSLSLTGKGHGTDRVIQETLPGETEIIFSLDWDEEFPNGFYLSGLNEKKETVVRWTVFSLGGGSIEIPQYPLNLDKQVYSETSFKQISAMVHNREELLSYVFGKETDLKEYLKKIVNAELDCVERGLHTDGILPGALHMKRSAPALYQQANHASSQEKDRLLLMAYAYAASEENGAGGTCVTAPTLGACGVMASLMYYYGKYLCFPEEKLVEALAVGGIFGNLIKENATISGAVGGCQAEIGAAVSMAAAAAAYLEDEDVGQIEYAAEIAMEHNLGLTCDPVMGYVMIPCIERNAMGILRAVDSALLAKHMNRIKEHVVSFDMVVKTMNETGKQIPIELKETSAGGLAREFTDGIS